MTIDESLTLRKQKFNRAFHFVLSSEGGTNPDPIDRGGLTRWGISERQYPNIDIAALTINTAKQIYYNDYWLRNKCDKLSSDLATVLFDSSVNCGQNSAAKWLQRSCNKLGSHLKVDGIIGFKTLFEVHKYSPMKIQDLLVAERLRRYVWMLNRYPSQVKYIKGWLNRVSDLLDFTNISNPTMFTK